MCSIVGAWIVEMFNRETDFLVALIFRGSALFIAVFLLPESLPPEHREQFQWSVFNSVKQVTPSRLPCSHFDTPDADQRIPSLFTRPFIPTSKC